MGATKHYHPISLHVIRGAAEYCGWKFGKITNGIFDELQSTATYKCQIEKYPRAAENWPASIIKKQLQHCFMDDIHVTHVVTDSDGKMFCSLLVRNHEVPDPEVMHGETKVSDIRL